jgi:hypothetical protein
MPETRLPYRDRMAIQCGDDPGSWAALADFASDLGHADWRNELLSFVLYPPDPRPVHRVEARPEPRVTPLRPAV